jgi:hypothetical protein
VNEPQLLAAIANNTTRTHRDQLILIVAAALGAPNPDRHSARMVGEFAIDQVANTEEHPLADFALERTPRQRSRIINDAMEHRLAARGVGRHPHPGRPTRSLHGGFH